MEKPPIAFAWVFLRRIILTSTAAAAIDNNIGQGLKILSFRTDCLDRNRTTTNYGIIQSELGPLFVLSIVTFSVRTNSAVRGNCDSSSRGTTCALK